MKCHTNIFYLLKEMEAKWTCQLTCPSMPFIPFSAPSRVAYFTKPKPLEYPDCLSVTTLAVNSKRSMINSLTVITKHKTKYEEDNKPLTTSPNWEKASWSFSVVVRLLSPDNRVDIEPHQSHGRHKRQLNHPKQAHNIKCYVDELSSYIDYPSHTKINSKKHRSGV